MSTNDSTTMPVRGPPGRDGSLITGRERVARGPPKPDSSASTPAKDKPPRARRPRQPKSTGEGHHDANSPSAAPPRAKQPPRRSHQGAPSQPGSSMPPPESSNRKQSDPQPNNSAASRPPKNLQPTARPFHPQGHRPSRGSVPFRRPAPPAAQSTSALLVLAPHSHTPDPLLERSVSHSDLDSNMQSQGPPAPSAGQLIADPIQDEDSAHLTRLRSLTIPSYQMSRRGYVTKTLTFNDLEGKMRCSGCNVLMSKLRDRRGSAKRRRSEADGPVLVCKYHVGRIDKGLRIWTCCSQPLPAAPCSGSEAHVPYTYLDGELEHLYQYHYTPLPDPESNSQIRAAVALDCEMGTAKSGDNELIRVTVIDYFTGAVLIDNLVYPDVEMEHFNTRYSGVTRGDMVTARREGTCYLGRDAVRAAIFRFVGPNTVVVGHGTNSDLTALRWIHPLVIDTYVIDSLRDPEPDDFQRAEREARERAEAKARRMAKISSGLSEEQAAETAPASDEQEAAVEKEEKPLVRTPGRGLKYLALAKLGRAIQTRGKAGHDSLEDAIAARDLAAWFVQNYKKPEDDLIELH